MKFVLDDVRPWRHELGSCLHSCVGTVLARRGLDPLAVLGARWEFYYQPGDMRREEYYRPCRPGVSLVGSMAPYHRLRSRWHNPTDCAEGWAQVRDHVLAGEPALVAVDNFWLPFRPAYQDVHSNHLVLVHGFDDEEDLVQVNDVVPPAFAGPLARKHLDAARDSDNPIAHNRDLFFTANPIGNRWLSIDMDAGVVPTLRDCVEHNLRDFAEPAADGSYSGSAGMTAFFDDMADRLSAGEEIREETFVVAGAVLASTALHASMLRSVAVRTGNTVLAEAARAVDRVAHHWTAVRILVNLIRGDEANRLRERGRRLVADHHQACADLERALPAL
jgi:hypothetical protein